jgi:chemosensory pili system protein ChpA (sensor histidine kinase/response regulator)
MTALATATMLSWVKTEVDSALKTVRDGFAKFLASPEDITTLRTCPDQLHQVKGTLHILGLNGATRFCETIEQTLSKISDGRRPSKAAIETLDRSVLALKEFIDGLSKGEANAPVRLFPLYRELSNLQGKTGISQKDLFFPDLTLGTPPHPAARTIGEDKVPDFLRAQRSRYQRGLLAWLRNSSDPGGLQEMRQALDAVDEIASQLPEPRALWWTAVGLIDGMLHAPEAPWIANAKSICSKLDSHLRDLATGAQGAGEHLLRELLYALATCKPVTPRVGEAKQIYQLDSLLPEPDILGLMEFDMDWLGPALSDVRSRLDVIKNTWTQYVKGEPDNLPKFRELVTAFKARINELGNTHLDRLLDVIILAVKRLPDPYPRQNQMMITEMSSAFLLIENIIDNFTVTPDDLAQQIAIMGGWVLDAVAGKSTGEPPAGLRPDLSQQISKMQLQAQVAREIINNLQYIEQVLDAFTRDIGKRDNLPTLPLYLRQIRGALIMLGFTRASELMGVCEKSVISYIEPDHPPSTEDMDRIAEGLSSLGLFLDPCLRGLPPAEQAIDFYLDRLDKGTAAPQEPAPEIPPAAGAQAAAAATAVAVEETRPGAAVEPEPVAMKIEAVAEASAPAAASPPATSTAEVNAELLGVFLEEAEEVLSNINAALAACRRQAGDHGALTVIRRGFHTLKGSGRMVGLASLGEIAWEIEQVMNHWLEQQLSATPALVELIAAASASFSSWVNQLKTHQELKLDAGHLVLLAQQLKSAPIPRTTIPPVAAESIAPASAAPVPVETAAATSTVEPEINIGGVLLSRPFYDIYINEAHQHLAVLETEFKIWREHPGSEASHEIIRAAHTLASISRTAGFNGLADLASALEKCLPNARFIVEESAVQSINAAIAKLREMLTNVSRQQPVIDATSELAGLRTLITHIHEPSAALQASSLEPAIKPAAAVTVAVAPPPAAAPADAAVSAKAATPERDRRAIRDDFDPQLLPIFLEEAQELLPLIGGDLRDWKATPADAKILQSLRRSLHTFKGGARMAGVMRLGELAHLMESRVEEIIESGAPSEALIEGLEAQMDHLSEGVESLYREAAADRQPAQPEAKPADAVREVEAPGMAPPLASPAVMLRINADTLDRMVNQAGEVGIARSRIEGELITIKQSILELADSIARLREQLREMEIQADSQMQSRSSALAENKPNYDPLEFDRYTRLQELTRMMAESLHDVTTVQQTLLSNIGEVDAAVLQQGRINRDLQQELMRTRTVPFSHLNERLYRIVRQTARELDKKANLETRDNRVELDRGVLEKISAPLEHMLRNAVAHGLEKPAERRAANKPEIGEISITVRQESNEIVIIVGDDGAGLNLARLRQHGIEKGLLQPGGAESDAELIELIFTPGFSTAEGITELSGRGVGMDVVRSEIASIGGRIETVTVPGKGTTFSIYVPLTLAVTQAVLVRSGESVFAISSAMVEHVLRLKSDALAKIYEQGVIEFQGNTYPIHYLQHLHGHENRAPEQQNYNSVLLLRSGIQRVALHVDELLGNQEIIIKNINPQLARVPGVTGATVLGDGKIVLIINPMLLSQRQQTVSRRSSPQPLPSKPAVPIVMIVDDSMTVRKITGRLLEREGYQVITAKDGVDALEQIKEIIPDIMLVDIEMPRMDGFDLTRNIRNDPRTAGIPIIIISSRFVEKHRSHAEQIGVNAFLGKPYEEAQLLEQISRCLRESREKHATYH